MNLLNYPSFSETPDISHLTTTLLVNTLNQPFSHTPNQWLVNTQQCNQLDSTLSQSFSITVNQISNQSVHVQPALQTHDEIVLTLTTETWKFTPPPLSSS